MTGDFAVHVGYRCQSPDTTVEAEQLLFERFGRMTPAEKVEVIRSLNRTVQELALAGLRLQFPKASDRELRLRLAARTLGRETVRRVFGFDVDGGRA